MGEGGYSFSPALTNQPKINFFFFKVLKPRKKNLKIQTGQRAYIFGLMVRGRAKDWIPCPPPLNKQVEVIQKGVVLL